MPPAPNGAQLKQFRHEAFKLASGVVLPELCLTYATFGSPTAEEKYMLSTCYGGRVNNTLAHLIGKGRPLDPDGAFIIIVGLLGGGESSSPSNTPAPFDGPRFPKVSYVDNANAYKLLAESLGVAHLKAFLGYSMGGGVSYHFGVLFPDYVDKLVVLSSSAATSPHNYAFLDALKNTMYAAKGFDNGEYKEPGGPIEAKRAFGSVWAPWFRSARWFDDEEWRQDGFNSIQDYLKMASDMFVPCDANDLLALIQTWQTGSILNADPSESTVASILGKMKPQVLLMPSKSDRYFRYEDAMVEIERLPQGKGNQLSIIESTRGHPAGRGETPETADFAAKTIQAFLQS